MVVYKGGAFYNRALRLKKIGYGRLTVKISLSADYVRQKVRNFQLARFASNNCALPKPKKIVWEIERLRKKETFFKVISMEHACKNSAELIETHSNILIQIQFTIFDELRRQRGGDRFADTGDSHHGVGWDF